MKYRLKRNKLLFGLIFPTVLLFSTLIPIYTLELLYIDTLITIYLPLLIIDLVSIIMLQPRLMLASMQYDYALMLSEHHEPQATSRKLFTTSWIANIQKKGFKVAQDHQSFMLMYQYYKKLDKIGSSDETIVFVVVAKQLDVDFYSTEIDHAIQSVYISDKKYQRVNKQITIQYKKYETLDESAKEEIEAAILFKAGKQKIINLTVGYLDDIQSVYCICPKKKFPNKYVYYACQEIKRLSFIKE